MFDCVLLIDSLGVCVCLWLRSTGNNLLLAFFFERERVKKRLIINGT